MGETSKHAASKHKRKEHRLTVKALARDGADRLAEAAKKREAAEATTRNHSRTIGKGNGNHGKTTPAKA